MALSKKEVPWVYEETHLFRSWTWDTDHFKATIYSEGREAKLFNWRIDDYTRSRSGKELASGQATTYKEAKNEILSCIGKSYPPKLQYKQYAGELATTFTIGNGDTIDFGELESKKVNLKVLEKGDAKDTLKTLTGSLTCAGHFIHLMMPSRQVAKIPPLLIQEVYTEFSSEPIRGRTEEEKRNRRARIYPGRAEPGCTGHNGFVANTVEHDPTDPWCPIHEKN